LVNTRNSCTSARQESDCSKITREVMDRRGAEEVEIEEPRIKINCTMLFNF
jgi:hypothetical protein